MNSITKFCSINKILCKVNKNFQSKALVHSSKEVWSDERKFNSPNQNILNSIKKLNQTGLKSMNQMHWWRCNDNFVISDDNWQRNVFQELRTFYRLFSFLTRSVYFWLIFFYSFGVFTWSSFLTGQYRVFIGPRKQEDIKITKQFNSLSLSAEFLTAFLEKLPKIIVFRGWDVIWFNRHMLIFTKSVFKTYRYI